MNNRCKYCEIPDRELNAKDYFDKMSLWRQYVNDGLLKFIGGDTALENFEEAISREDKYIYYHYFECDCGIYIQAGVCIRSSVPILKHLDSLPSEI